MASINDGEQKLTLERTRTENGEDGVKKWLRGVLEQGHKMHRWDQRQARRKPSSSQYERIEGYRYEAEGLGWNGRVVAVT